MRKKKDNGLMFERDVLNVLKGAILAMEVLSCSKVPPEKKGDVELRRKVSQRKLSAPEQYPDPERVERLALNLWKRYSRKVGRGLFPKPASSEQMLFELVQYCVEQFRKKLILMMNGA